MCERLMLGERGVSKIGFKFVELLFVRESFLSNLWNRFPHLLKKILEVYSLVTRKDSISILLLFRSPLAISVFLLPHTQLFRQYYYVWLTSSSCLRNSIMASNTATPDYAAMYSGVTSWRCLTQQDPHMTSEVVYTLAQKGHDMFPSHTWDEMKVLLHPLGFLQSERENFSPRLAATRPSQAYWTEENPSKCEHLVYQRRLVSNQDFHASLLEDHVNSSSRTWIQGCRGRLTVTFSVKTSLKSKRSDRVTWMLERPQCWSAGHCSMGNIQIAFNQFQLQASPQSIDWSASGILSSWSLAIMP